MITLLMNIYVFDIDENMLLMEMECRPTMKVEISNDDEQ